MRHVADQENPADFLTKWLSVEKAEASIEFATNSKNAVEATPNDYKSAAQATFDRKLRAFLAQARAAVR